MIAAWLPIETAPKDREVLILFGIRPDIAIAQYSESARIEHPEIGGWLREGTWLHEPTHWMPLPSDQRPPAAVASPCEAVNYDELDPGIRETVRLLNDHGFETTDSGDGVSKPQDWYDYGEGIPFPHVVVVSTPETMIADAERCAALLGPAWNVEAEYQTLTKRAHLFVRTLDERERQ